MACHILMFFWQSKWVKAINSHVELDILSPHTHTHTHTHIHTHTHTHTHTLTETLQQSPTHSGQTWHRTEPPTPEHILHHLLQASCVQRMLTPHRAAASAISLILLCNASLCTCCYKYISVHVQQFSLISCSVSKFTDKTVHLCNWVGFFCVFFLLFTNSS